VIQEYGIGKLTFVVNKNIKKEYRPSFDGGRCEVCFDDPEYPFLPERTAHLNGDYKLLDWFQFIILARASRGEAMEEVPVSVTSFSKDKKPEGKRFMSGIPVSVKELAEMAGASTENHILVDHPFSGVVLDPGTRFDRLKPIEILVFPKNTTKSESFLNRFFCKFRTSYRRFEGLYETTDIYRNRACRKCLRCVTICPAKIQPFLLSAIADRGSLKDAVELNVADCIECGLCSCACPSGIPLMKNIVMLKKEL
jgi:ferredoxin